MLLGLKKKLSPKSLSKLDLLYLHSKVWFPIYVVYKNLLKWSNHLLSSNRNSCKDGFSSVTFSLIVHDEVRVNFYTAAEMNNSKNFQLHVRL